MALKSFFGLLLLAAIGLSTWSLWTSRTPEQKPAALSLAHPDAYMENVTATLMSKAGTPILQLITPKITHYAEHDTSEIEKPAVTIYRRSPQVWTICSDYAKATQGIAQIIFLQHVRIHHLQDTLSPTTTLETASLTVFPDKQTAETPLAVLMTQPNTIVHAVGMFANMHDGTIQLLSQAKGEYVPTS